MSVQAIPDFLAKDEDRVIVVDNEGIVQRMFDDSRNRHPEGVVERGRQVVLAEQDIEVLKNTHDVTNS